MRTTPSSDAPTPVTTPMSRPDRLRPWVAATIESLPKLTALTLASAIGGGGGTGGGGSTVFGILFVLLALASCTSDDALAPSAVVPPLSQVVSCRATVATGAIDCSGPSGISTPEILGGQGNFVALHSSNVHYDGSAIFQADVDLQNLAAQTIGAPGGGVDVFFQSGPTVTGGTGAVTVNNPSGTATFTHSNQKYFHYADSIPSGQYSGTLTWKWNVPATVTTFTFTVEVSAEVEDEGGVLLWSEIPEFASDSFTGIAVNSSTDVMAVGIHGATMHKVGGQWQRMPVQLNEDWVGVSAIGGGKYVGATLQGSVALFDGKVWKVLSNRGYAIHGVTAYDTNRIAVGGANKIEWYGNSGWFSIGVGGGADFTYFATSAPDQGFGLSTDGDRCAFNFSSGTPSCGGSQPGTAAYGWVSGNSGYASESGNEGSIWDLGASYLANNVNDTTFTALELGSGGTYLWAAAMSNTTGLGHLDSWSGGVWTEQAQLDHQVIRMVQDSAGGLYLLSADGIRHWNGSALVDELVGPQTTFPTAIGGGTGFAFVGMNDGEIRRYDGSSWTTTGNPGLFLRVASIAAFSATSAAVLDTAGQYSLWNGSAWSFVPTYPNSRAIWGVDATHMVMVSYNPALSGTSYVSHGDPFGSFAPTPNPAGFNSQLNAIWGTSDTDFWLAGNGGVVIHYNGSSYTSFAPGTANDLFAATGTGNSDLWVAGAGGYIAHWDGGSWTQCTIGGSTIRHLFSPRAGVVYVGTGATTDTLTAALCGARAINIPGAFEPVTGLSGTSADALWAIVGTRIYLGHR